MQPIRVQGSLYINKGSNPAASETCKFIYSVVGVALHRWSCPSASWETLVIIDINLASIDYDSDQLQDHSLALDTTPRRRTALTRRDETLWKITIIMSKRKTNKQTKERSGLHRQTDICIQSLKFPTALKLTTAVHYELTRVFHCRLNFSLTSWLSKQQQEKTLSRRCRLQTTPWFH